MAKRKRLAGTVDPSLNQQIKTLTLLGLISPKKAAALRRQAKIVSLLQVVSPPASTMPSPDIEVEPGVVIGECR